ncbi:MAG: hypothetical protein Q7R41_09760, partial [Phycisphaerales bacterium]|nr:hypothetical protein [Phycisphaerales bacterium]
GVDGIRFPDGTLMTSAGAGSAANLANTVDAVVNADSDANASGAVRLQTAAADRLYIANGGNVGIGTTSPAFPLTVFKTNPTLTAGNYYVGEWGLWTGTSDTGSLVFGYAADGTSATAGLIRTSNNVPLSLMPEGGNVGIGTVSPTAKLHIGGTAGVDGIRFPDGTLMTSAGAGSAANLANTVDAVVNADSDANASGAVRLQTAAVDRLHIANGGNVGIGTTSPAEKLDVAGSIRSSGGIRSSSGTFTATGATQYSVETSSGILVGAGGVTAPFFVGDGSALTGIATSDNTKVAKTGDFMSGQLTTESTMTVKGDAFSVGGSTLVVTGGKVGIGTATPGAAFVLQSGNATDAFMQLKQTNASNPAEIRFVNSGNTASYNDVATIRGEIDSGSAKGRLTFLTRGTDASGNETERMRLDSTGNVGIGTASPTSTLHLLRNNAAAQLNLETTGASWGEANITFKTPGVAVGWS